MKAIVVSEFGDESVLRWQEAEQPEPVENEVRVRIKAAGVNPVETYIRAGKYGALPDLPYTPGNDGAGLVDKVGPGVASLSPGQKVFIAAALARRNTGTYAEYTVCDEAAVRPLPDRLSFSEGAGLGTPGLAAANALFAKAGVKAGQTVLIHGATGGVGTLAVQLARQAGAIVIGTAGDQAGEALAKEMGAHHVFNHNQEGYLEEITKVTDGNGPEAIIEMVANVNLAKDLAIVARHGRIVIVGSRGSLDFDPRAAMTKDAVIMGMLLDNMPAAVFRTNIYTLSAALENGLKVTVNSEFPLQKASEAHKAVASGKGGGKVILVDGQ